MRLSMSIFSFIGYTLRELFKKPDKWQQIEFDFAYVKRYVEKKKLLARYNKVAKQLFNTFLKKIQKQLPEVQKQSPECSVNFFYFFLKNFMAPFSGWGSTASRLEPLRGGSLLFTSKFPEIPGTHFTDLGRMKGWVDLGVTQWFWTGDSWIGNPAS